MVQIFISSFAFCRSITIVSSPFMVTWRASGNDRLKHFATWNWHVLNVQSVFNACFFLIKPYQFFQTLDSATSKNFKPLFSWQTWTITIHLWIGEAHGETHGTDGIFDPRLKLLTTELCHPHQKITRHGFDKIRSAFSRLCKKSFQILVWHVLQWLMRIVLEWCLMSHTLLWSRKVRAMRMQWHHKPLSQPHWFKFTFKVMKSYNLWGYRIHSNHIPVGNLLKRCHHQMPPRCCQKDLKGVEIGMLSHKYRDLGSKTTKTTNCFFWKKITSNIFSTKEKTKMKHSVMATKWDQSF